MYSLHDYPPLYASLPCRPCGRQVEVEATPAGDVAGGCPHVRRRLRRAIARHPEPHEIWGGQRGYAVAPLGAIRLLGGGGYKYAAPFEAGRTTHILGRGDGVYVALALDEAEWLALTSPNHYPCDAEDVPGLSLPALAGRVLVGRERQGLIVFEPLAAERVEE